MEPLKEALLPNLDTLVSDVYSFLQGKKINDAALFREFGENLGEVLSQNIVEEHSPGLRMSNIGRPTRQLWYETHPDVIQPEPISGSSLLKFSYGHILEALVVVLARAAGHVVERQQEEIEIDGIPGHIDCVLDGVLVDVKSASPYSYNKFVSGEILQGNDPFGYVAQLAGYSSALSLPAAWVIVNKVTGELHVLRLPEEQRYDVRARIEEVSQAVAGNDEPERCYEDEADGKSGNRRLSVGCNYCGFKSYCWRDSNEGRGLQAYGYSNGVKYLTRVVREPRVDVVEYESFTKKENHN